MSEHPRPVVQFVAAPEVGARVLLDLNADDAGLMLRVGPRADGWDLGSPSLSGPVDGTGRLWGSRTLTFNLQIRGPRDTAMQYVSQLSRVLLRRRTSLLWQLDPVMPPVWFEVWGGDPGRLVMDRVTRNPMTRDLWEIELRLQASPWAVGEKITKTIPAFGNDPTDGGGVAVLDPIVGDAPTPLTVQFSIVDDARWSYRRVVLSACSTELEAPRGVVVWQASQMNRSGTVSGVAAGDGWPGDGYVQVTSGHGSMQTRVTVPDTVTGELRPGRFAVYVLVGATDGTTVHDLRVTALNGGFTGGQDVYRFIGADRTDFRSWVPCGEVELPIGVHHQDLLDADDLVQGTVFAVASNRVSGSGTLNIGAVRLIPLDGPGIVQQSSVTCRMGVLSRYPLDVVFDGAAREMRGASGTTPQPLGRYEPRGGFPMVVPGAINTLQVVQQASGISDGAGNSLPGTGDDARHTVDVTYWYRPRILWIPSNAAEAHIVGGGGS